MLVVDILSATRCPVLPFFRLASKFTDSAVEELLFSRECSQAESFPCVPRSRDLRIRTVQRTISSSRSIDHSFAFVSSRVRLLSARLAPIFSMCVNVPSSNSRFVSSHERLLLDFHPLMQELSLLLSLSPFSPLLFPSSPPVRNSDSFQGNVYPRRKMRLKCIGACFPRRARAISTRILWVYHMTAPYLGIHAYRCKDFGKREISLRYARVKRFLKI